MMLLVNRPQSIERQMCVDLRRGDVRVSEDRLHGAQVGPGCLLEDTIVGEDAVLLHVVCRQAEVGSGALVTLSGVPELS